MDDEELKEKLLEPYYYLYLEDDKKDKEKLEKDKLNFIRNTFGNININKLKNDFKNKACKKCKENNLNPPCKICTLNK